jgi:hypothetical protein
VRENDRLRQELAKVEAVLLHKSQARLEDVQREIDGLRMKRREVETSLEGIISIINNTISFVREQDAAHRDEKILLHWPRQAEAPATAPHTVVQPEARSQG